MAGASDDNASEVHYLQSQNGNLHSANGEFEPLTHDVPKDISWCSEALGSILSPLRYKMQTQFHQDICQRRSIYGLETKGAQQASITVKETISTLSVIAYR